MRSGAAWMPSTSLLTPFFLFTEMGVAVRLRDFNEIAGAEASGLCQYRACHSDFSIERQLAN